MRKRGRIAGSIAALAAVGVGLLGIAPAEANDIAKYQTVFATDVVYAGVGGMRGNGTGTITVAGVTGSVTKALLYWHGPTNSDDPASNATVAVDGTPVTGTNIGTSDNNCWGYTNSQAYRADVTSLVSGNGAYALTNMRKAGPPVAEINGAELVVFFDDGNAANNRDVVLFNGNDSNITNTFDADGWNVTLPGINYASGSAALDLVYSDTQVFNDSGLLVNGSQVSNPGVVLNGSTVPNAGFFQGLWDQKSYDITTLLTPGDNTVNLTLGDSTGDCISLIVAGVNLPAGAAPNQPSTTTTSTTAAPTTTAKAAATAAVAATPAFTG